MKKIYTRIYHYKWLTTIIECNVHEDQEWDRGRGRRVGGHLHIYEYDGRIVANKKPFQG